MLSCLSTICVTESHHSVTVSLVVQGEIQWPLTCISTRIEVIKVMTLICISKHRAHYAWWLIMSIGATFYLHYLLFAFIRPIIFSMKYLVTKEREKFAIPPQNFRKMTIAVSHPLRVWNKSTLFVLFTLFFHAFLNLSTCFMPDFRQILPITNCCLRNKK